MKMTTCAVERLQKLLMSHPAVLLTLSPSAARCSLARAKKFARLSSLRFLTEVLHLLFFESKKGSNDPKYRV